ncbi:MAG: hypothetical protein U0Z26_19200, partial [Anaerolineales bacterium]
GNLTKEEWNTEFLVMINDKTGVYSKLQQLDTITDIIAYTHGEKVYSVYRNTETLLSNYIDLLADPASAFENQEAVFDELIVAYATMRQLLREKLISIRDF